VSSGIQEDLRAFATKLLERRGGLVEWPVGAVEGTAVVPPAVAHDLGIPGEAVRLAGVPGNGSWNVSLAGDFLETSAKLLEAEPRTGAFSIGDLYLKRGSMEDAVRRAFTWLNAKVQVADTRAMPVEYHTWWFRAGVVSEDRWETRFSITINSASGSEVELPDLLKLWDVELRPAAGREAPSTYQWAAARALPRVKQQAAEFFALMDRRLERDRKRIRDYYGALLREMQKKPRGGAEPDAEKLAARKRAVDLELRRKQAELDERYAMEAVLEPLVLVRVAIPTLAVDLSVHRKSARKRHTVYWNPLTKHFEPLRCSRCGGGTFTAAFTDEEVQPLCAECAR
jgi:hypothetical protein